MSLPTPYPSLRWLGEVLRRPGRQAPALPLDGGAGGDERMAPFPFLSLTRREGTVPSLVSHRSERGRGEGKVEAEGASRALINFGLRSCTLSRVRKRG
jgi:hypothetical protein